MERDQYGQHQEALDLGEDFDDEDEDVEDDENDEMAQMQQQQMLQQMQQQQNRPSGQKSPQKGSNQKEIKGQAVENQPFDLAVEVNDSEEIESDEDEDEVNVAGAGQPKAQQQQPSAQQQQQQKAQNKPQQLAQSKSKKAEDDDEDDDSKLYPGAYNPAEFANLQVSNEVKDLFEYIQRYKPQKVDLDTKLKPYIPEYIPAVGEVDAFLKMNKPDGQKEELGIIVLDEPSLNHEDKTVLELKYVQSKNVVKTVPMTVESIENADKKPKDIARWINSVQDLHKTRPPPTVNYTKQMPDPDFLMSQWPPEMEHALKEIPFPGPEIDMHVADYARMVCSMLDIPCHKLANNKSVIESLHNLFSLYSDLKQNVHLNPGFNGDMHQF